jgi:hypothetical protein
LSQQSDLIEVKSSIVARAFASGGAPQGIDLLRGIRCASGGGCRVKQEEKTAREKKEAIWERGLNDRHEGAIDYDDFFQNQPREGATIRL